LVRALVGQLQASAEVDDTERAALGRTLELTQRMPKGGTGVPPVAARARCPYHPYEMCNLFMRES
ncbi:MAG: hypothetical protein ABII12_04635, partial [Planctomycetota bacterium]